MNTAVILCIIVFLASAARADPIHVESTLR